MIAAAFYSLGPLVVRYMPDASPSQSILCDRDVETCTLYLLLTSAWHCQQWGAENTRGEGGESGGGYVFAIS